jgi:hypothetical protein
VVRVVHDGAHVDVQVRVVHADVDCKAPC